MSERISTRARGTGIVIQLCGQDGVLGLPGDIQLTVRRGDQIAVVALAPEEANKLAYRLMSLATMTPPEVSDDA